MFYMFTTDERLLAIVMPRTDTTTNPSPNHNLNPNYSTVGLCCNYFKNMMWCTLYKNVSSFNLFQQTEHRTAL